MLAYACQADEVRAAIATPSLCNSHTVSTLQNLLSTVPTKAHAVHEVQTKVVKSRKAPAREPRPTATRGAKATGTKTRSAPIHAAEQDTLQPREKHKLALDIVNSSLKVLTDTLKPQAEVPSNRTKVKADPLLSDRAARKPSLCCTPSSLSQHTHKSPREPLAELHNSSSPPRPSSTHSSATDSAPSQAITAVAECSRIAFSYLRSSSCLDPDVKPLPALQVESGMLALIGKLIPHGLDNLAAKELRISKRRLERYGSPDSPKTTSKEAALDTEKETLATLLRVETRSPSSPLLALVVMHQTNVLKLISTSKRVALVESLPDYLDPLSPHSPAAAILNCANLSGDNGKAARQLDNLAKLIFNLCPSTTASNHAKPKSSISPQVAFRLQIIALSIRKQWWQLAGHHADSERELFGPLSCCLETYRARSSLDAKQKYSYACSTISALVPLKETVSTMALVGNSAFSIYRLLSTLAQLAGMSADALQLTKLMGKACASKDCPPDLRAAYAIRSVALHIDVGAESSTIEEQVHHCKSISSQVFSDRNAQIEKLLVELAAMRKLVVLLLTQLQANDADGSMIGRKKMLCETIIFSTMIFKQIVQAKVDRKSMDGAVLKIVGPFIGSSLLACNVLARFKSQHFGVIHEALEDCVSLAEATEGQTESGSPFASISNVYWLYYQTITLAGQLPTPEALQCLRRSIEILKHKSPLEQQAGFLAVKLEKIASLSTSFEQPLGAHESISIALKVHLSSGVLHRLAEALEFSPLQASLDLDTSGQTLMRVLSALHRASLQKSDYEGFYDDGELATGERATLLEVQATFQEQSLTDQASRVRNYVHFRLLMTKLLGLYTQNDYPLRRARTCARVLTLQREHPGLFEPALLSQALDYRPSVSAGTGDHGLERFAPYITSSLEMAQVFHTDSPAQLDVVSILKLWQSLVDGCISWEGLKEKIESLDTFILQLRTVAAFLAMRGDTENNAEALQVLLSVYQLQPIVNASLMYELLAELSLQYLRMGYSGVAESMLDLADLNTKRDDLSNSARIRHCLAQVEINLAQHRQERAWKWSITLEGILQSVKASDTPQRSALQRTRADAALVYSLICAQSGDHETALLQAHRSVRLNRHTLSVQHQAPAVPTISSGSVCDLESITKGVNGLNFADKVTSKFSNGQPQTPLGSAAWTVVPSLLRGLNHLSLLYAQSGLQQDAKYFAQEAKRLADTVGSIEGQTKSAAVQAILMAASGESIVPGSIKTGESGPPGLFLELIELHTARGDVFARLASYEEALEAYDDAEALAVRMANRSFNDKVRISQQSWIEQPRVEKGKSTTAKASNPCRTTQVSRKAKPPIKVAVGKKPTTRPAVAILFKTNVDGTVPISKLRAIILRQKSLILIRQGQLAAAITLLEKAESIYPNAAQSALQQLAYVRAMLSKFAQDASVDFTFNVLPESTISYPALSTKSRRKSCTEGLAALTLTPPRQNATASSQSYDSDRRKQESEHFTLVLHKAQDRVMNVQSKSVQAVALATCYQICGLACEASVLLSAIDTGLPRGMLHPTRAALSLEMPRIEATCREISSLQFYKSKEINQDFAKLGLDCTKNHASSLPAVHFQRDFIDIMPEPWTAISLGLSEDCKELYVTQYRFKQAPFILRLPLVRNKMHDLDDDPADEFGFEAGKAELHDIINLSNYSCHRAPNPSVSGAKTMWWAEREALDHRMHELLINIENIWLGGFKSVLSQHHRQPDLLARFRKTFESILDRHLPSRQGAKGRSKKLALDSNVLELFVGLGDDQDGAIDIDEQILDLLYFVIDILQFNGEHNAYDEVDFDSIATETMDALRSYHEAAMPTTSGDEHLILILDKKLHAFPWESLPCLDGKSVSRVGSMLTLRERIVAMRRKQSQESADIFTTTRLSGTCIMNPSSDLVKTQAMMEPLLSTLQRGDQSNWNSITNRTPTQEEFKSALSDSNMLLYFGHGSGNQYIRERDIRKLKQCSEVVWLMGCSSGAVTENGDFEPTSVPLSYLMAGEQIKQPADYESRGTSLDIIENGRKGLCMAVLATLWDVTDKDIDRFSVRVGEEWGLWDSSAQASVSEAGQTVPKTPGKRGRGAPKTPAKTPAKTLGRARSRAANVDVAQGRKKSLVEAVAKSREVCHLRYLNGAATVVYGIPIYLGD